AEDLRAIERGEATQLEGTYPNELNGLTSNLNALIRSEREQLNRYRNSLSDLAHSLKTPLAILQNEIDSRHPTQQSTLVEQVERMSQLVDYQLQRAASAGRTTLAAPLVIEPLVKRVVASLDKVYADKALRITLAVDAALTFQGDKSDLLEIFGNLLDNAYKWAKQQVTIKVTCDTLNEGKLARLTVTIEDDGPGIPEEKARLVLQRGGRADEQVGGHGIGLAVVRDIVQLYDGQLEIAKSTLGGARVCFYLYA
ncbi:MAG: two-component system OmpR family sensor histidine kinase PhoQ, partial [Halothiobacillaceae bacterium]